jgi:hypothetical protein
VLWGGLLLYRLQILRSPNTKHTCNGNFWVNFLVSLSHYTQQLMHEPLMHELVHVVMYTECVLPFPFVFRYLVPDYTTTCKKLATADIFSFGVMLVELITGRKAVQCIFRLSA